MTDFAPLPPPVDPLRERSRKEVDAVLKKKKKMRVVAMGSEGELALKKAKEGMVEEPPEEELGETRIMVGEAKSLSGQVSSETAEQE